MSIMELSDIEELSESESIKTPPATMQSNNGEVVPEPIDPEVVDNKGEADNNFPQSNNAGGESRESEHSSSWIRIASAAEVATALIALGGSAALNLYPVLLKAEPDLQDEDLKRVEKVNVLITVAYTLQISMGLLLYLLIEKKLSKNLAMATCAASLILIVLRGYVIGSIVMMLKDFGNIDAYGELIAVMGQALVFMAWRVPIFFGTFIGLLERQN